MQYEMKDSRIEWLGAIPYHWEIKRGKNCLTLLSRPVLDDDDIITCFRDGEVTLRKNRREEGFTNALLEIGYQGVNAGDLVVHGMDGFAGAIGISDSRGKASPVLNVMDSPNCKRFLMYYLRSLANKEVFLSLSTGIRVRSCDLRWNKLAVLPFILPPLPEQTAIAAYLDDKCGAIDEIIEQAKASIEEYKAWKSSVIFEAVTKGLNPNAEMKDSGVEWIGKVPNDWNVGRLKFLLKKKLQYGANSTGIEYNKNLPRYIRITDITKDGRLTDTDMLSLSVDEAEEYILEDKDILLARSGATAGKAFIFKSEYGTAAFAGYLIRAQIKQNIMSPEYVYYSMLGSGYEQWRAYIAVQATIPNIGANKYNDYELPIPPLAEQNTIVDYLDEKCAAIDGIIADKETLIADMEAYKKSLIFETVTGKRKVC